MSSLGSKSVEHLNHFRCGVCDKWWSVGDPPVEKKKWFCAWCGEKQEFKDISPKVIEYEENEK